MIMKYYIEIENPNRFLRIPINQDTIDLFDFSGGSYDYIESIKIVSEEYDDFIPEEEKQRIFIPNKQVGFTKIIPLSQISKLTPKERDYGIQIIKDIQKYGIYNGEITKNPIKYKNISIISSYISKALEIVDITTAHKSNDLSYPFLNGVRFIEEKGKHITRKYNCKYIYKGQQSKYDDDFQNIKRFNKDFTLFKLLRNSCKKDRYCHINDYNKIVVDTDTAFSIKKQEYEMNDFERFKQRRNHIFKLYKSLKEKNIVDSTMLNDYYHLMGIDISRSIIMPDEVHKSRYSYLPKIDYSEDIRKNLLGLLSLHIAIYDSFIEIYKNVDLEKFNYNYVFKDMVDYFVKMCDFSKIETSLNKHITTSKINIYGTFFNYIINGFTISTINGYRINKFNKTIETISNDEYYLGSCTHDEKLYKKEAQLILKKVPREERHKYML